ncbi:MAG: molybdopterin-guanine dinucleotide biosynthesis protein B [Gammaproteobacteria bacterium]|nr:molybdopterin-guanine dinucleotide biosynthesis protein B [Gammaproteobacteria bacterium]
MLENAHVPIFGFAAFSGTGKTTLIEKIIPLLTERGLHAGVVKHAHHSFDIDMPGKDTYRFREAGASPVLLASRNRWILMAETPEQEEPQLDELLLQFARQRLDLILVEGFKHENFPKIELHRPSLAHPLLFPKDKFIIAVASDEMLSPQIPLPLLDINQPRQIVAFILEYIDFQKNSFTDNTP